MNFNTEKYINRLIGAGLLLLGIILILGVPVLINEVYKYGRVVGGYTTLWSASDSLQYYGILLGATSTIIAVVMTINNSKKSDRNRAGIEASFKLIESCEINKLYNVIEEVVILSGSIKGEELVKVATNKLMNISTEMNLNYVKLQFLYPKMTDKEKIVIYDFLKKCSALVLNISVKTDKIEDEFLIYLDNMKELENLYDSGFAKFSEDLQKFISSHT